MNVNKDMNILVVDDQSSMRAIVKETLNRLGFTNVDLADDGATALPKLTGGNFDFLISDWNMPNMTGIDLLRAVRKDEKLAKLPVLLLTAEAKQSQIIEAAKAGVNDYIVKPFNAEGLNKKIERIFSKIKG